MCAGVAVLAETASIAVSWGSTSAYHSILFALYTLTIVLIGNSQTRFLAGRSAAQHLLQDDRGLTEPSGTGQARRGQKAALG